MAGTTIYNALALAEVELSTTEPDRPVYPPKLLRVDVVHNPFPDIAPRITREEKAEQARARQRLAGRRPESETDKKKKKKNTALLSFGEEEDIVPLPRKARKPISSHDLLQDKRLSKQEVQRKCAKMPSPEPVAHRPASKTPSPPRTSQAPLPKEVEEMQAAIQRETRSAAQDTKVSAPPKSAGRDLLASMVQQYQQKNSAQDKRKAETQTLTKLDAFRKHLRSDAKRSTKPLDSETLDVWGEEEHMREYGASDEEDAGSWREHRYVNGITQLRFGRRSFGRIQRPIFGA